MCLTYMKTRYLSLSAAIFLILSSLINAQTDEQNAIKPTLNNENSSEYDSLQRKIDFLGGKYIFYKEWIKQCQKESLKCQSDLLELYSKASIKHEEDYQNLLEKTKTQEKQRETEKSLINESILQLKERLDETRKWTDSIIVFWSSFCALVITGFGIVVPLITLRKHEEKLHNHMLNELRYLELKARSLITDNKSEKMELYDKMIDLKPSEFLIYSMRGDLFIDLKCFPKAIRNYDKSIELASKSLQLNQSPEIESELANFYWRKGMAESRYSKYSEALISYERALDYAPNHASVHLSLGNTYHNLGKRDLVTDEYKKAKKYSVLDSYNYCMSAGHLALDDQKLEKAIDFFTKAISLAPSSHSAFSIRACAFSDRYDITKDEDDYKQAEKDFNKAIKLNPTSAGTYNNRGLLYESGTLENRLDKALTDYNKALELNPEYFAALNNRGGVYFELSEYQKAINDYNGAIKHNENFAHAYVNRGRCFGSIGIGC